MPATIPTTFFGWVSFLLDKYGVLFLQGVGVTLKVALSGTILGFLLGLLVAIVRTIPISRSDPWYKRFPLHFVHWLLGVYIEVFRGTPMIVQSMVIYYGSMSIGIRMPVMVAAIFIVSINTGAYMAEIIRAGIESVDRGQMEAARSLGMPYWRGMQRVVLPQAIRTMIPSIINQFIITLKDTSILSVIGFPELVNTAKNVVANTFMSFQTWAIVAVMYLVIITALSRFAKSMERKMKHGH